MKSENRRRVIFPINMSKTEMPSLEERMAELETKCDFVFGMLREICQDISEIRQSVQENNKPDEPDIPCEEEKCECCGLNETEVMEVVRHHEVVQDMTRTHKYKAQFNKSILKTFSYTIKGEGGDSDDSEMYSLRFMGIDIYYKKGTYGKVIEDVKESLKKFREGFMKEIKMKADDDKMFSIDTLRFKNLKRSEKMAKIMGVYYSWGNETSWKRFCEFSQF